VERDDCRALIANIDVGGDGEVQYDDFVRLVCPPKSESSAVTASKADLARINSPVPTTELNLSNHVFFMGGRAVKRVLGPGEAALLRHSSVGDVGNGVGSDALRESVMKSVDAVEMDIRKTFFSDLNKNIATEVSPSLLYTVRDSTASNGLRNPPAKPGASFEERVELASLPPVEQVNTLITHGIFPPINNSPERSYRVKAPWVHDMNSEPDMEALIAESHASLAAGREYERKIASGEINFESESGASDEVKGGIQRQVLVTTKPLEDLPHAPTHIYLPISPLAHTSRITARRNTGIPYLTIPGQSRSTLIPSSTTNLDHPLSYLTEVGSSALPISTELLQAVIAPATRTASMSLPKPNSLDRSLHAVSKLPPLREGLTGPLSSTESSYDIDKQIPDGGPNTIVVGHLSNMRSCESISASSGNHSLEPLSKGPFFRNSANVALDKKVQRLRLSARDVLDLPGSGRATAVHLSSDSLTPQLFSPLSAESEKIHSPRNKRLESRRNEFLANHGRVDEHPKQKVEQTLRDELSTSKSERMNRIGSVLGLPVTCPPGGGGAATGELEGLPVPLNASSVLAGSARTQKLLATAARNEGQRTTWLLAPPPTLRAECTPEHPSWHYASSARLAQTQTAIPEQALARLVVADKFDNLRTIQKGYMDALSSQHNHDHLFACKDVASRIARKREERGVYKEALFQRKLARESMLSAPYPVGEVQL